MKIGFVSLHGAECKVFLSTDAGGVGLNLQAASAVINFEPPWNPARLEQRIGRVHRLGQAHPVQVIHLLTEKTIEERVWETLELKKSLFAGVFDSPTSEVSFAKLGRNRPASRKGNLRRSARKTETHHRFSPISTHSGCGCDYAPSGCGCSHSGTIGRHRSDTFRSRGAGRSRLWHICCPKSGTRSFRKSCCRSH